GVRHPRPPRPGTPRGGRTRRGGARRFRSEAGRVSQAVPPVVADRLELVSMSPAFITALMAGDRTEAETILGVGVPPDWPEEIHYLLQRRLDQMRRDPGEQQWLARAMVLRADRRV